YCLGYIEYDAENYAEAATLFEKFISFDNIKDEHYKAVKQILPQVQAYRDLFTKPVPFNPVPVMDVCTPLDEYLASLSPDNRSFYFIRKEYIQGQKKDQIF